MIKQELIEEFYVRKKDLETEMKSVNRDFERYYSVLGAIAELIELAEQLDEPKECILDKKYNLICMNCNQDYSDYQYDAMDHCFLADKANYCPNCGAKIKREV